MTQQVLRAGFPHCHFLYTTGMAPPPFAASITVSIDRDVYICIPLTKLPKYFKKKASLFNTMSILKVVSVCLVILLVCGPPALAGIIRTGNYFLKC